VQEYALATNASGERALKRRGVGIPTARKLVDKRFVSKVQRFLFSNPAQCFRMMRIAAFPAMLGENIPKAMKLPVLSKEMFSAKMFWMDIPDTHRAVSAYYERLTLRSTV
jgi:hypothetical protein